MTDAKVGKKKKRLQKFRK